MKRVAIYLVVTFGLTWGLLIPAGFALGTFRNGESSSVLMVGLIALSMFFPLVGALAANFACKPEERIDLAWRPLVGKNIRHYLAAWFAPAGIALLGAVLFFVLNPLHNLGYDEIYDERVRELARRVRERGASSISWLPQFVRSRLLIHRVLPAWPFRSAILSVRVFARRKARYGDNR